MTNETLADLKHTVVLALDETLNLRTVEARHRMRPLEAAILFAVDRAFSMGVAIAASVFIPQGEVKEEVKNVS